MDGPHKFDKSVINRLNISNRAGHYLLCDKDPSTGEYFVQYVGRSDSELRNRLYNHELMRKYNYFYYEYSTSPLDAYKNECINYHNFGGSEELEDNENHPASPKSDHITRACPICEE